MHCIWKFELKIEEEQSITMPDGAEILCVHNQNGVGCLWAKVNREAEGNEDKIIIIRGTGHIFEKQKRKIYWNFPNV
ncbi:MAG: hypothetical protein IIC67_09640 [Thaumarchaeota archaeon]|nr:hypothetical protein [Nitrososphaerota archaeon]